MTIRQCIVVIKQTALAQGGRVALMAQKRDETARRLIQADKDHHRTVAAVDQHLLKRRIPFRQIICRTLSAADKRALGSADFVISIGGDGTTLYASHYVRDGLMVGVNSAPGDSVGHFCALTRSSFADRFDSILEENWHPTPLARLQIKLENTILPELALNDVLIAHDCPASTTRYLIAMGDREEEQRSSGIWISTAAGSTAGIRSAGGRKSPLRSRRIQYLIRELYREPNRDYQLIHGFIDPKHSITIASKMPDGDLYIDGARTIYPFHFGARATIEIGTHPLKMLV
jgi:NAD+ kinase